jgi:hypothetical protein
MNKDQSMDRTAGNIMQFYYAFFPPSHFAAAASSHPALKKKRFEKNE